MRSPEGEGATLIENLLGMACLAVIGALAIMMVYGLITGERRAEISSCTSQDMVK